MNTILFDFENLTRATAQKKITRAFAKYQVEPISLEAAPTIKRASGISYRELVLAFSDSQQAKLRIKKSGDVYQVLINNRVVPIKHQDDHLRAVREIVDLLDAKRAAFQKAQARRKTAIPKSLKTAAPKLLTTLTQRRDDLIVTRDGLRETLAELTAAA